MFCFEFPDIPEKAGRKTRTRRTKEIAKRYAFHANAIKPIAEIKSYRLLVAFKSAVKS